jgi:hypothetical protein
MTTRFQATMMRRLLLVAVFDEASNDKKEEVPGD